MMKLEYDAPYVYDDWPLHRKSALPQAKAVLRYRTPRADRTNRLTVGSQFSRIQIEF